jgi:hypothetical protein
MITEDYVSFETAKLLKEKRFNEKCRYVYMPSGLQVAAEYFMEGESFVDDDDIELVAKYNEWITYTQGDYAYLCPTLQMARKWLKGRFNVDIVVCVVDYNTLNMEHCYYFFKVYKDRRITDTLPTKLYRSHEEAEEAAIRYCLENLA